MLKFYVTCRHFQIGGELVTARDQFRFGFKGLDVSYDVFASNRNIDGRTLYEVILGQNSEYTEEQCLEYRDIIVEGLSAFGCHIKTLESAKAFAEYINEREYEIVDGAIRPIAQ